MLARASLPAEPASAGAARRFVRATLASWDLSDLDYATSLLVSELVTNAVLHAGSASVLTLAYTSGILRVVVDDESPLHVRPRSYSRDAGTGRGLMLVEAMASSWGSEPTSTGKRVWFEIDTDMWRRGIG